MCGICGLAIAKDTLRYSCNNAFNKYFNLFCSRLLNIVAFKNAVNVTISNFTNLIAMLQLHMD